MDKVKTILISQPQPENDKNPYAELSKKNKVKIDFRPFIQVVPVEVKEFRKQRINLLEHGAVIFTSRNAIDHYFRIAQEMRVTVPDTMKFFCLSEAVAYYLQKYIVYRKRKIFYGRQQITDLLELMRKHKNETFLLPSSDILKESIPQSLDNAGYKFKRGIFYRTVCSDLSDLADVDYDMLVFFSPSGITSLFKNFPDFKQRDTRIAAFGPTTTMAVKGYGLNVDVLAPTKNAPSMSMAIEKYIKEANKR